MQDLKVTTKIATSAALSGADVEEFKSCFRGEVLCGDDEDYDDVRTIWNGMHDKRPALIARCTGVADVIDAVNFSRKNNLLVAVRGGGHNVGGSASCDGGIMIDLSLMKGIRVNPKAMTVHAQGGATWGDLDRETQVFGLAAPGGVVSTTGIAGLTLGGGLGWLRRKHGLSIDNLLSVDIVTADGQFYTASESENSDLFWGVRGGGGNFGVVTSFEFRLHPVGPMVTLCAPWYPVEMAQTLLPAWQEFMKTAPEELSSTALFWTVPPAPNFPPETHGKRVIIFAAVYVGPIEDGERITKPLRELATPLIDLSGPILWTAVQSAFDGFFPKKVQLYYFKSRYLSNLDKETINAIVPLASNPPQPMVLIAIWHYGGAMTRKGHDETAFTGRDAPFLFSVDAVWNDPKDTEKVVAYARNFLKEMEPYSTGGMYVNFAGLGEEGDALVKSAYGANYERLVALKNKYDPTNLFRLNQNIKPAGAKGEANPKLSLYERLGGETGLRKIVNDILDKNFNNPLIAHHFRNIDMGKLKQLVFEFFSMGIGGPHQYTGRDMRSSHADLKITDADFESGNDDVLLALKENEIGLAEQNEVIAILNSMKGDVVSQ